MSLLSSVTNVNVLSVKRAISGSVEPGNNMTYGMTGKYCFYRCLSVHTGERGYLPWMGGTYLGCWMEGYLPWMAGTQR